MPEFVTQQAFYLCRIWAKARGYFPKVLLGIHTLYWNIQRLNMSTRINLLPLNIFITATLKMTPLLNPTLEYIKLGKQLIWRFTKRSVLFKVVQKYLKKIEKLILGIKNQLFLSKSVIAIVSTDTVEWSITSYQFPSQNNLWILYPTQFWEEKGRISLFWLYDSGLVANSWSLGLE